MEEKRNIKIPHHVIMEERSVLSVSGVMDIDSFDDQTIVAYTELGEMLVKGTGLHINKIDLESGDLSVEGNISSISYSDQPAAAKGFLAHIFR
ncbi:MAG: sporulation protein YabP [Oscillospiraceae bacterium]|nr:sporulation protein YabP [Oscillospiraceae bacterium]